MQPSSISRMAFVSISIDKDGYVKGSGPMPEPCEPFENPLSIRLVAFIKKVNQVRDFYHEALSDDGRMIGQERYDVTRALDGALTQLLALRHALHGDDHMTIRVPKFDFELQIEIHRRYWDGNGMFGKQRRITNPDFQFWLKRIQERLLSFVKYLNDAQLDGEIDSKELHIIIEAIDRIFCNIIIVRDNIESGLVN